MKNVSIDNASSLEELLELFKMQYDNTCNWYIDILKKYASECDTVVEFGTWNGLSAVVFALSGVKSITSCDLDLSRVNQKLINNLSDVNINFIKENSLNANLEYNADLIFLDTVHTYEHVKAELSVRARGAKKYLIIHDTNYPPDRKNPKNRVRDAVNEFLVKNKEFKLELEDRTSTGIMVLKRC